MSANSPLSTDGLQVKAKQAFDRFRGSQEALATILDIDRSAVSRAIRHTGMKHAAVQSRIISYVDGVPVQRQSTYMGSRVHHQWIIDP